MSRTVIDLDDELVASAAKALGTSTKKETVNTALREVLEIRRRALALTPAARGCRPGRGAWRGRQSFRRLRVTDAGRR
jgi:Arc/MetJ family transcription regulator